MSSRACAALIADLAFKPTGATGERNTNKHANKAKKKAGRFRRSQID